MAETTIEGVYTIRIEQGPALREFEKLNKQLTESRLKRADLQKEIKKQIAEEQRLEAAIRAGGEGAASAQAKVNNLRAVREVNNRKASEAIVTERALGAQMRKLSAEISGVGAATNSLSSRFDAFVSNQGRDLRSTLSGIALQYVGVGAAVYGAQQIIGAAVTTVLDFDQALASVSALGGEYAANIKELGDAAKEIGPKFGIGPTQAVASIEALAKAGVSAADILGGALEGALTLSASGSLEAGQAAEFAASAMVQFGLNGKDVVRIADLLSAAANKAQGEVSDFGNALKFIGPVAAANKVPLEEVVGALALFAENGILGEMAGTSLRGVIASLTSPSKEASKELLNLGIVTKDGSNLLYDAQGNFKGLANTAEVLKNATKDLTDEERNAALGRIFGNQQLTAANILLKSGAAAVEDWTEKVNQSGTAAGIAAGKLNSVRGDVSRLTAAWQAMILEVDEGDGAFSRAARGGISLMIARLGDLSDQAIEYSRIKILGEFGKEGLAEFDMALAKGEARLEEFRAKGLVVIEDYRQALGRAAGEEVERGVARKAAAELNKDLEEAGDSIFKLQQLRSKAAEEFNRLGEGTFARAKAQTDLLAIEKRLQVVIAEKNKAEADSATVTASTITTTGQATDAFDIQTASVKELRKELKRLKDEVDEPGKNAEAIAAIEARLKALNGQSGNTKGSIADLNAQIAKLREQQSQSTDSELIQGWEAQIDELTMKIKLLKGEITQEMFDLAQQPAQQLPTRFSRDLASPDQRFAESQEQQRLDKLAALRHQYEINTLLGIRDFENEKALLQAEADTNTIRGRELLNAGLTKLDRQQQQENLRQQQIGFNAISDIANSFQALRDQQIDSQIATVDEELDALQEKLSNASTEAERERIEMEIKGTKARKKELEERKKDAKGFAIAAALIQTYLAGSAALAQIPFTPANFFQAAAAIATGLANVAQIQGFAGGGTAGPPEERGRVTSAWGVPIRRSNGDNVLVTLKEGEDVLNAKQKANVKRKTGFSVGELAGLPGYPEATLEKMRAFRRGLIPGYAGGGTTGYLSAPRLSSSEINQSRMIAELSAYNATPHYLSLPELEEFQGRRVLISESGRA